MKKTTATLIAALIINLTIGGVRVAAAKTKPGKEAQRAEKVKAGILKLGLGKDALAEVKLRDGMTVRGYVSKADDNSFVVTDVRTGRLTVVPYSDVTRATGNNFSTGAKIAVGVGIAAAAAVILFIKWAGQFK